MQIFVQTINSSSHFSITLIFGPLFHVKNLTKTSVLFSHVLNIVFDQILLLFFLENQTNIQKHFSSHSMSIPHSIPKTLFSNPLNLHQSQKYDYYVDLRSHHKGSLDLLEKCAKLNQHKFDQNTYCPKVDGQELKNKILKIFSKDKQKLSGLCDHFVYALSIQEHCNNIKQLMAYVLMAGSRHSVDESRLRYSWAKNHSSQRWQNQNTYGLAKYTQTLHSNLSRQVSFLSPIFSRDKMHTLLKLHSAYQKIYEFMNSLYISLQSFAYANEQHWILMKDEVQRYILKYERNVDKIIDIDEENQPQDHLKAGSKKIQREKNQKLANSIIRKTLEHRNSGFNNTFTLKNYKKDIYRLKKRIQLVQQNMCRSIKNALTFSYQSFQNLIQSLRQPLNSVSSWAQKAQKFKASDQKDYILRFLLVNRSKGYEAQLFLEQIYKCLLVKLQDERIQLDVNVTNCSKNIIKSGSYQSNVFQCASQQFINELFQKFEASLKIKAVRRSLTNENQGFRDVSLQLKAKHIQQSRIIRHDSNFSLKKFVQQLERQEANKNSSSLHPQLINHKQIINLDEQILKKPEYIKKICKQNNAIQLSFQKLTQPKMKIKKEKNILLKTPLQFSVKKEKTNSESSKNSQKKKEKNSKNSKKSQKKGKNNSKSSKNSYEQEIGQSKSSKNSYEQEIGQSKSSKNSYEQEIDQSKSSKNGLEQSKNGSLSHQMSEEYDDQNNSSSLNFLKVDLSSKYNLEKHEDLDYQQEKSDKNDQDQRNYLLEDIDSLSILIQSQNMIDEQKQPEKPCEKKEQNFKKVRQYQQKWQDIMLRYGKKDFSVQDK